eukprot:g17575.t1
MPRVDVLRKVDEHGFGVSPDVEEFRLGERTETRLFSCEGCDRETLFCEDCNPGRVGLQLSQMPCSALRRVDEQGLGGHGFRLAETSPTFLANRNHEDCGGSQERLVLGRIEAGDWTAGWGGVPARAKASPRVVAAAIRAGLIKNRLQVPAGLYETNPEVLAAGVSAGWEGATSFTCQGRMHPMHWWTSTGTPDALKRDPRVVAAAMRQIRPPKPMVGEENYFSVKDWSRRKEDEILTGMGLLRGRWENFYQEASEELVLAALTHLFKFGVPPDEALGPRSRSRTFEQMVPERLRNSEAVIVAAIRSGMFRRPHDVPDYIRDYANSSAEVVAALVARDLWFWNPNDRDFDALPFRESSGKVVAAAFAQARVTGAPLPGAPRYLSEVQPAHLREDEDLLVFAANFTTNLPVEYRVKDTPADWDKLPASARGSVQLFQKFADSKTESASCSLLQPVAPLPLAQDLAKKLRAGRSWDALVLAPARDSPVAMAEAIRSGIVEFWSQVPARLHDYEGVFSAAMEREKGLAARGRGTSLFRSRTSGLRFAAPGVPVRTFQWSDLPELLRRTADGVTFALTQENLEENFLERLGVTPWSELVLPPARDDPELLPLVIQIFSKRRSDFYTNKTINRLKQEALRSRKGRELLVRFHLVGPTDIDFDMDDLVAAGFYSPSGTPLF